MRDVIDEVDSKSLEPAFDEFFVALQRGKHLERYRFLGDHYLVSVDGSGYFGSENVCCPGCLRKESNSWVTDIPVSEENIRELVRGGRCRWKIENETFNTLKNQGYHIEHNFGHGKKNLSMNFFLLNLLAFFTHQILELTDLL